MAYIERHRTLTNLLIGQLEALRVNNCLSNEILLTFSAYDALITD